MFQKPNQAAASNKTSIAARNPFFNFRGSQDLKGSRASSATSSSSFLNPMSGRDLKYLGDELAGILGLSFDCGFCLGFHDGRRSLKHERRGHRAASVLGEVDAEHAGFL